jgi:hypothetical protein
MSWANLLCAARPRRVARVPVHKCTRTRTSTAILQQEIGDEDLQQIHVLRLTGDSTWAGLPEDMHTSCSSLVVSASLMIACNFRTLYGLQICPGSSLVSSAGRRPYHACLCPSSSSTTLAGPCSVHPRSSTFRKIRAERVWQTLHPGTVPSWRVTSVVVDAWLRFLQGQAPAYGEGWQDTLHDVPLLASHLCCTHTCRALLPQCNRMVSDEFPRCPIFHHCTLRPRHLDGAGLPGPMVLIWGINPSQREFF